MQTTTLLKLRKAGACTSALDKIRQHLGKDYARDIAIQDAIKAGCTLSELIWALRTLKEGKELAATFAILSAKRVCKDRAWNDWANSWLGGTDRSKVAANAAAAVYIATHAASAATYAAHAAAAHAASAATHADAAATHAATAAYADAAASAAARAAAAAATYAASAAARAAANATDAADDAAAYAATATADDATATADDAAAAYGVHATAHVAEKQYQLQLLVELCNKE